MIDIIVSEDEYNKLAKEGSLMMERETVSRGNPTHKHSKDLRKYGPLELTDGFKPSNFSLGCGIKAGQTRRIRWQGWRPGDNRKQGKRDIPVRGGIVVTALSVAYCKNSAKWEVTFIKQMESVPTVYLAPGMGHTQNASKAIQDAGQVPYDQDVAAMLDDEREAAREKREREAKHRPKPVKPEPEPEYTEDQLDNVEQIVGERLDELAA
jgi:hypothetical protein